MLVMIRMENWRIAHYGDVKLRRVIGELNFGVIILKKMEKNMEKHSEKYWRTHNGENNGEHNWRTLLKHQIWRNTYLSFGSGSGIEMPKEINVPRIGDVHPFGVT